MSYNPHDYIPDFTWAGQLFDKIGQTLASGTQVAVGAVANKQSVDQARDQALDAFTNLGIERLGLDYRKPEDGGPSEAERFAAKQVRKPTANDYLDPEHYLKQAADLVTTFDQYQQAYADYQFTRSQNPGTPPTEPPPMPKWGITPEQNLEGQKKWYDRKYARYLSGIGQPVRQPLSVQANQLRARPTPSAAPGPDERPQYAPGAGPWAPGSQLQVTPQTATPTQTGRTPPAPVTGAPTTAGAGVGPLAQFQMPIQQQQAGMMAQGVMSGRVPESQFLIEQQQETLKRATDMLKQGQEMQQFLIEQYGPKQPPEGMAPSAAELATGEFRMPLAERYEPPQRPAWTYGAGGISEDIRREQNITRTRSLIGTSIDRMGDYRRRGVARDTHISNIAGYFTDLIRNLTAIGEPQESIERQIAAYESQLRKIDPDAADQVFGTREGEGAAPAAGVGRKPKFTLQPSPPR